MSEFTCKHCGHKISIPDAHTSIKGTCPNCKKQLDTTGARSVYNLTLLDVPQLQDNQEDTELVDDTFKEAETTDKRELPWIIDFLLYPLSKAGLTIMAMMIIFPLLIIYVTRMLAIAAVQSVLILLIAVPIIMAGFVAIVILCMYMFWYLCECIRDSAAGGIRAPETMGISPGLGEIIWNSLRLFICVLVFVVPIVIYYRYAGQADTILTVLYCCAILFFPMALLAVVIFDSLSGLNPILLTGSIISTFLPYCAMVSLFTVTWFVIAEISASLFDSAFGLIIGYVFGIYLLMVAAHVLGWFYHRYQEQLSWNM